MKRREFIKGCAAAFGIVALPAVSSLSRNQYQEGDRIVRDIVIITNDPISLMLEYSGRTNSMTWLGCERGTWICSGLDASLLCVDRYRIRATFDYLKEDIRWLYGCADFSIFDKNTVKHKRSGRVE